VSEETLKDKANQIASGLADKPVLLLKMFRYLREDSSKIKVAGPWTKDKSPGDAYRWIRYDVLSDGNPVGTIVFNGGDYRWGVTVKDGDLKGNAPTLQSATEVIEHFLAKDGWTLAPSKIDVKEFPDEEEDDDDDVIPIPKIKDPNDDVPF